MTKQSFLHFPYKGASRITTLFGVKGNWACGWHIGLDLVGMGDKTILALAPGVVERIDSAGAYGNHIRIQQENGHLSLYAHLSKILVKRGQKVQAGQAIGAEGSTGNSTASHLHLEIHQGGYRYPAKGSSPATAPWLIDPCQALGIEPKLGEVKKVAEKKPFTQGSEVIQHWAEQGIIDSPDYWRQALIVVKSLEKLLLKTANFYEGRGD